MISKEEVLNLAQLSRLKLGDAEAASLQKDISNILDYVEQIKSVEVSGGQEAAPAHRNVMRDDVPVPVLGKREDLLAAFPKRQGDYNVVRKILQKDE